MFYWAESKKDAFKRMDLTLVQKSMNIGGGWYSVHSLTVFNSGEENCTGFYVNVNSFQKYLELLEDGYKEGFSI